MIVAKNVGDAEPAAPGDISFRFVTVEGERHGGMKFQCPCGCGRPGWIPLSPVGNAECWKWNGDEQSPTLTPSILQRSCQWHGFLTAGVFKSC